MLCVPTFTRLPTFPSSSRTESAVVIMVATTDSIRSLSDLKSFVYQTLCRDHGLLVDSFPTQETVLKSKSGTSGMLFCLYGPRSVQLTAIWDKGMKRVLFYQPTGERYSQVDLTNEIASDGL